MNTNNEVVLEQLIAVITQANAHVTFDQAVENIAFKNTGVRPRNLPYSIWELVEHIRIAQWDILEFSKGPAHKSPKWPNEYWPKHRVPDNEEAWRKSLEQIKSDRNEFIQLLTEASDIYTPFTYGDGQNLVREALLIADHTSYHTGQIILLRRLLEDWDK